MEAAIRSEPALPDNELYDEYYYGYRTIIEYDENGKSIFSYRPLTPDDFLDPEEGDVYMQGTTHTDDVIRLRNIFRHHLKDRGNLTVFCDLKIEWGIPGMKNPAPDICVVPDVKDPEKHRGTFEVRKEDTKPFFILEVVSPRYREADVAKKPEIYRRAGVSEYIIADPGLKDDVKSYTVKGFRLIGNRYVDIPYDKQGRICSKMTGVRIGVSEARDRLVIYDSRTDEEILSDEERAEVEAESRALAEIRAEREKSRAEKEKQRAELSEKHLTAERARAERLAAKLRELGISPDEI